MTRVELTELARQDLETLIRTRELPAQTYVHVRAARWQLSLFPEAGRLSPVATTDSMSRKSPGAGLLSSTSTTGART